MSLWFEKGTKLLVSKVNDVTRMVSKKCSIEECHDVTKVRICGSKKSFYFRGSFVDLHFMGSVENVRSVSSVDNSLIFVEMWILEYL